jgi:ribosome-interacting GTPase 1
MRLTEAIYKLNPTIVTIRGDVAYDANEQVVEYDLSEAQALVAANEYQRQRATEYPPIGDQLDALWKGGEAAAEMLAKVQAVKSKYPKGTV